ncbi:MAG: hypothetical protein IJR99_11450 [Kiritimatiellae bacterium]|nr:hypothetical protein [Kiritimatiellia bacterium]
MFDVRFGADGKSIAVRFRDKNILPGIYSEVWTIPTSDLEIPEITFPVSARVADGVTLDEPFLAAKNAKSAKEISPSFPQ